ncbi:hypothetical protein D3C84_780540 [compost metagenome]
MANKKRRLTNRELRDLHKIERLLDTHQEEHSQNNQPLKVEMKANVINTKPSKFDTIELSPHAYQRASERFKKDESAAPGYFRSILKQAKRIGLQKDSHGNDSILYAHGRIAIYVEPDLSEIKTVLKQESVTYSPIKTKVAELHEREIRKLERTEKSKLRNLQSEELQVNVEIANAKLRIHKTRSEAVRMACAAHIKGLEEYIGQLKEEIETVQSQKRQVCRSMVAVV